LFSLEKMCRLTAELMPLPRTPRRLISRQKSRYAAPALDKGLDILELLANETEGLTRSEISRRLGRTVGELFRMMVCLEERGYISDVGPDERFQLTLKLFEVAHRHHPLQHLLTIARPLMQRVAAQTSQSCHLAMQSNGDIVVVACVEAPVQMGFSVRVGAIIDLLNTASGHVILAFHGPEYRSHTLACWRRKTKAHVPRGLDHHLSKIRQRGYEELGSYQVHGVVNISFPVLNQHGESVAAMSVPFLGRIGDDVRPPQVKEQLAEAALKLSQAIGGRTPLLAAHRDSL
jgi:DNA-binding IclR family transcriptional regulator